MISPVKKRKLFNDGGSSSPTSKTLPRYSHESDSSLDRTNRRSLTPDDTLSDEAKDYCNSPVTHSFREHPFRKHSLSNDNISQQKVTHPKGRNTDSESPLQRPKPKLLHAQSSPSFRSDSVIQQLKRTGISFESDIGLTTPPISPEPSDAGEKSKSLPRDSISGIISLEDVEEIHLKKAASISSKRRSSRSRVQSALEERIESLLQDEGIDFTEPPYSNQVCRSVT